MAMSVVNSGVTSHLYIKVCNIIIIDGLMVDGFLMNDLWVRTVVSIKLLLCYAPLFFFFFAVFFESLSPKAMMTIH